MNAMGGQITFPTIGKRSPVLKFAAENLRRAYFYTNAAIFIFIVLIVGYVKYQQWQYEQQFKKYGTSAGKKVITVTYAQLGPPPSITGDNEGATPGAGARASAPTVGVPKPVPDAEAAEETSPTQDQIAGTSPILASGTGSGSTILQVEAIPDINAYVPHEVEPKVLKQPLLEYPPMARTLDQQGTVFVKALVDLNGSVMRVVVLRGSGYPLLDTAAVVNVFEWKFSPALQRQKPVRVWIAAPIRFQLKG